MSDNNAVFAAVTADELKKWVSAALAVAKLVAPLLKNENVDKAIAFLETLSTQDYLYSLVALLVNQFVKDGTLPHPATVKACLPG